MRQFRGNWDHKKLGTLFYCMPRYLDHRNALHDKISRRLRQIETFTICVLTWSPAKLAYMAGGSGPFAYFKAEGSAQKKLKLLSVFCPGLCGDIAGPARKI